MFQRKTLIAVLILTALGLGWFWYVSNHNNNSNKLVNTTEKPNQVNFVGKQIQIPSDWQAQTSETKLENGLQNKLSIQDSKSNKLNIVITEISGNGQNSTGGLSLTEKIPIFSESVPVKIGVLQQTVLGRAMVFEDKKNNLEYFNLVDLNAQELQKQFLNHYYKDISIKNFGRCDSSKTCLMRVEYVVLTGNEGVIGEFDRWVLAYLQ